MNAPKQEAKQALVKTVVIEIHRLRPKGTLRLTQIGGIPLGNGAKVRVPVEVAQSLRITHPSHVKIADSTEDGHHFKTEDLPKPRGWQYDVISGAAVKPVGESEPPKEEAPVQTEEEKKPEETVDTTEKTEESPQTKVGKATNRSMGGKGKKK